MESGNETRTLVPAGTALSRDPGSLTRGAAVGRYVILRCLGAGGMGVVYAAWDSELDRKVALKLLRPDLAGTDSEPFHARLLGEAQALARLSHPNVVAVYDAGTFEGRVFLVMEFVDGVTLAEWVAEEPRSWREVVARFHEAALGLAAVHGAGLVHRDVKPGNLMLGGDGRVRVVDFGLAQPAVPEARPTTNVARLAGTPAFMAPEQYRGQPADARCDQFGFCVSLYSALCGELPFGSGNASEILRRIERGDVAEPAGSRVPGWLGKVVLRGMTADPERRFPSMESLAEALAHDPAARRRRWVGALAAFVLLAVGLASFFQQRAEAALVCRGAERKLDGVWDSERRQSLRNAFLAVDQPYAAQAWRHVDERLDRYLQSWVEMHVEACEATRLRAEQSESLMDLRLACLGERLEEARTMTDFLATADERAIARSASMLSSLSSLRPCADTATLTAVTPPPREEAVRLRVDALRARVARAKTMTDLGRPSASLPLLEETLGEAKQLSYAPLEADVLLRLAEAHGRLGRIEPMEETLYEALAAALEGRAARTAAQVRLDFVIVSWMTGRFAEAERWAKLAHASIVTLGDVELEAHLFHRLGMLDNRQGRHEEAIDHFRAALDLKRKIYPPGDPRLGYTINNIGIAYRRLGRHEEALEKYREYLGIVESAYGPFHPDVAVALLNIGITHRHRSDPRQALAALEQSLAIYEKIGGTDHFEAATPLEALGEVHLDLGEPDRAKEILERSLVLRIEHGGDPLELASTRFNLARALVAAPNTGGTEAVERARRLAQEARSTFVDSGPRAEKELEQVESWLAEHGRAN